MSTAWTSRYALRTKGIKGSAIRELLKITQNPEIISFAGGLPAPELFPIERFQEACHKVLSTKGASALQYGATEGYEPLREMIAQNMARYGIRANVDNVLITSGSQQALDLIGKLLINSGDRVLLEAPTYLGALQAFNVYGAEYVSVPSDEDGLQTDSLERSLRSGPKFMYVLPNFQNPGGTTLAEGRRHELVLLADKYGIPIVEDDPYGQLRYEGEHLPALIVIDRENLRRDTGYHIGNVIYLSTFSKTLAPGIRLGWIVAPPDVISKFIQLKQAFSCRSKVFRAHYEQWSVFPQSAEEIRKLGSLGDLPLVVISRDPNAKQRHTGTPALSKSEQRWQREQRAMAQLSSNSTFMVAEGSGHSVPKDRPDVVINAIRQVVEKISKKTGNHDAAH